MNSCLGIEERQRRDRRLVFADRNDRSGTATHSQPGMYLFTYLSC